MVKKNDEEQRDINIAREDNLEIEKVDENILMAHLEAEQNSELNLTMPLEENSKVSSSQEARKIKFSIRTKLIVLFLLVSLIPILIISIVSYKSSSDSLKAQIFNGLTAVAEGREVAISLFLEGEQELCRAFSSDGFIRETLAKMRQNDAGVENLSGNLNEYLRKGKSFLNPFIYEVMVLDLEGKVVASSDNHSVGKDKSSDDYFISGQKGVYVKDVYFSKSTGKKSLSISAPLKSKTTGNVIGVIVNRINTKKLNKITTNREGLGQTGEVYIVNKDGYMISESRFQKDTFLKQEVSSEPVRLFQKEGKIMVGIYGDYRGDMVIGASMGDDLAKDFDLGWTILAEMNISEAFAPIRILAKNMGVIAIVIAIVVIFIAYFMAQRISVPLRNVVDKMDQISRAGGDLTQKIPIRTSDELGLLSGAFNGIQAVFHNIVSKIAHASLSISSSSNEILASANQQESASTEQSAQIIQIQTVMNQAASTSAELATSAQETSRFADEVSQESQEGASFVEETNAKMSNVGESNAAVSDKLTLLSGKVEGIGKMLTTIISVADKTNLLSLNAAIEAAKAGEHGKGFNVVAQEIRRLADQTAQSSTEINNLITEIQSASSSSLMAMEKSSKDVFEGVELVRNLGNRFSGINERIENMQDQFKGIVSGISEQASGNKEVAMTLTQMTEALKLTAAASVESRRAATDLTSMSQQLRTAVGQFKLR